MMYQRNEAIQRYSGTYAYIGLDWNLQDDTDAIAIDQVWNDEGLNWINDDEEARNSEVFGR